MNNVSKVHRKFWQGQGKVTCTMAHSSWKVGWARHGSTQPSTQEAVQADLFEFKTI